MDSSSGVRDQLRSWMLALLALALCGPWPHRPVPWWALALAAAALAAVARPRRSGLLPWLAVGWGLVVAATVPPAAVEPAVLQRQLGTHGSEMLALAEKVADQPVVKRVFASPGKAVEPELPFELLEQQLRPAPGRTLYLADDRGRMVAWAGAAEAFPVGVRKLGERQWAVVWQADAASILVREPVLVEGRLVGAVTVVDHAPLGGRRLWGMAAPQGCILRLGDDGHRDVMRLHPREVPAIEVPVRSIRRSRPPLTLWAPWLALVLLALAVEPRMGLPALAVGALSVGLSAPALGAPVVALAVLLTGAAVGRMRGHLRPSLRRMLVGAALLAVPGVALIAPGGAVSGLLPVHALAPGWGVVWTVALAWALVAWPGLAGPWTLARRVMAAAVVAAVVLVGHGVRVPALLARQTPTAVAVPAFPPVVEVAGLLPAPPGECRLDDLAPVLARHLGLHRWPVPSALVVVGSDGEEVSRWGDLGPAGSEATLVASVPVVDLPGGSRAEVWAADAPWSWLRDWQPSQPLEAAQEAPVWYAVLTRAGAVAATLHGQVRPLDPARAGGLFHAGGGWTWLEVGGEERLARVWRRDDWLVAVMARYPAPWSWLLESMLAGLWALAAMLVACPPVMRREAFSTFGGRLRVLLAAGVVLPLVLLTVFLSQRLHQEEARVGRVLGLDSLRAARWTLRHLAGSFTVDDRFAGWLGEQVGGEVLLFDGTEPLAASRPDLLAVGRLPGLPPVPAFARFLLGREDPIVLVQGARVVAASVVEVQDRRLLLEVFPSDPLRTASVPGVVDWLLTGSALAGLLALLVTSRLERRLSASLRELVGVARRVHRGEPVGTVAQPPERDLADVITAVRSMSEEVQRREQSLRDQEELLRITLSTLAPAVLALGADGSLRFANPSGQALLASHRELVLEHVLRLGAAASESPTAVLDTVQPVPGSDLTWRLGVAGVPFPDGTRGLVAVVDDVSEVVRVDRLRHLAQLARIVAHEVKNPLTPIRLWVQELDQAQRSDAPDLDELLREACREIGTQVERLQATANSFSNLVALERWEAERVDVTELVEDTLSGLSVLERRGIRLVREVPSTDSCIVVGDRQWLRRALANLVRNSVDALGGEPGEIAVRVTHAAGGVAIEVEDSGGGVPESQLLELFSPQFSTTTSGSGLGLALVRHVVSRCQGTVAASNGRRGLLVRVELPEASATIPP